MVLLTLVDRFDMSPCGCEISQLLNFKWERERDRHARRKRRARNFKERARFRLPDSHSQQELGWPGLARSIKHTLLTCNNKISSFLPDLTFTTL